MDCRCQRPVTGLLSAIRLLYLGVQAFRLETIVLHWEVQCLSGTVFAVLILGILLGLGSHIAVLANGRAPVAGTARLSKAPLKLSGTIATAGSFAGARFHWLQSLVVPLSMAGLVLELLSGAPPAALRHSRTLAILLLLSIALQRDPLWEALPQLAAALALDFAAFLAAARTGQYDTPQAVVQHLLSTTVAAMAVVGLIPLYNKLSTTAAPESRQKQQQQGQGGMWPSSLAAEAGDPTALEQPLVGLPPDVIQVSERHLLRVYRRKLSCERVASAFLVLAGVLHGPTMSYSITAPTSPALACTGAAADVILPPLLRLRAVAASLALITSSTLLLLNGLLAQLPGRLYGEHCSPINSIVTVLHALGHVTHVIVFAPAQRSRALLVRMMAALTANLVANEDPWLAFLAQLLALLALVAGLDKWLGWGVAAGGDYVQGWSGRCSDHAPLLANAVGMVCGAGSSGGEAQQLLIPWLPLPGRQSRVVLEGACDNVAAAASTTAGGMRGRLYTTAASAMLPTVCYLLIAVTGAALCRSLAGGKYRHFYRLYRRFYLPASYGGTYVTAALPYNEVLQLRDGRPLDQVAASSSSSSSATTGMVYSPCRPSTEMSRRSLASRDSSRRGPTRRSVSLNTFMGIGGIGVSRVSTAAHGTPNANTNDGHPLAPGAKLVSPLSSTTSERLAAITAASAAMVPSGRSPSAVEAGAMGDVWLPPHSLVSPFIASSAAAAAAEHRGPRLGSGGGAPVALGGGETAHVSQAAAMAIPSVTSRAADSGDAASLFAGGGGPEGARPMLGSTLELDEADVISGKINVTRQLSKLAALGGGSMGARDIDRLVQSLETSTGTNSSANAGGVTGMGFGASNPSMASIAAGVSTGLVPGHRHDHQPTRGAPVRRSSDISHLYGSASKVHSVHVTGNGGPVPLHHVGSTATAGGAAIAGGSFLESVAASLASEEFVASGVGAHGGFGAPSGGQHQRVQRLRAAPARASSDLAAGRQPSPHLLHQMQTQHPLGGLPLHRLPRRSPSDVSHLAPSYNRNAKSLAGHQAPPPAASSRYGLGILVSPPGQRAAAGAMAGGAGGAATTMHPPGVWIASAAGAPGGGGSGYGGGMHAASYHTAMSPGGGALAAPGVRGYIAQRRGPSRQPSRQYTAMIDSTGLTLLGQNLITIGGSSGGPNHVILSSLHSPNVSGVNAVSGVNSLTPERSSTAAAAGTFSSHSSSTMPPETTSVLEGNGANADTDPFGAVSSLEPVRGLRPNRGQRRTESVGSGGTTPTGITSRTAAFVLGLGSSGLSTVATAPMGSPRGTSMLAASAPVAAAASGVAVAAAASASAGSKISAAKSQTSTDVVDATTATMQPSPAQMPTRLSAPQLLVAPLPWQHNELWQPQQQQQLQQQREKTPSQSKPPNTEGRSDTEPHLGSSLSFRRDFHGVMFPQNSTLVGGTNVAAAAGADAASIRAKMRVSWSDMEARGSGGSTGTILTTASEVSKASTAGTDPTATAAAAADALSARWPRVGSGSGSGIGVPDAQVPPSLARQGGRSRAASGAGLGTQISAVMPAAVSGTAAEPASVLPSSVSFLAQQQLRNPQHAGGSKMQPQQCGAHLAPQQSGGSAATISSGQPPSGTQYSDGPRGSGEPSDTLIAVEMEHMRVARELAAMWTSSSVGELSSQMVPSTQSSVAAGAPPSQATAAFAMSALVPRPTVPAAAPYDIAARGLSVVQEASETLAAPPAPVVAERSGSTRQRRLSQIINPGQPLCVSRAGGRTAEPQQLHHRLRDLEVIPRVGLSGDCAVDSASVQSSIGSGVAVSGPVGTAASIGLPMSSVAAGGSVSSLAGVASTAMSFDNWATADDLAAMLLGPAVGGSAPSVSDLAVSYSPVRSSSWRAAAAQQSSRLAAPSLAQQQQHQRQASSPDPTGNQHSAPGHRLNSSRSPGLSQNLPSSLGPRHEGFGHGAGNGNGASSGGSSTQADMPAVVGYVAGVSRSGPAGVAPTMAGRKGSAAMRRGVLDAAASLGAAGVPTPRYATQSQLPSGSSLESPPVSQSQFQLAWGEADRMRPLRSPSVPNMSRSGGRVVQAGSVRRTSSMGKSRLGSMSSASSSTQGFLNAINTALFVSPVSGNAAHSTSQQTAQTSTANPHMHLPQSPLAAAAGSATTRPTNGGRSTPQLQLQGWPSDAMDSYAHLPPMRASQTQLALSLPASSLRGSVVGRRRGGLNSGIEAVDNSIARGLSAAGATVSGPVGWALDATQQLAVRRARRVSLDERLLKQVVTARLLHTPPNTTAANKARTMRRSVGSMLPSEYVPSRLSQDGKAVRVVVVSQPPTSAPVAAPTGPSSAAASGPPGAGQSLGTGPNTAFGSRTLSRHRSLGAIPELHAQGWQLDPGQNLGAGVQVVGSARAGQAPAALATVAGTPENHRLSVAGSVATAITASSTSLQSFADVALGAVNYY